MTSVGNSAFASCNTLTVAEFLGDAPTMGTGFFDNVSSGFTIYYHSGSSGFTTPVWNGYATSIVTNITVSVAVVDVVVERWGAGPKALVFFSHSGDLMASLKALSMALFPSLLGQKYSMFYGNIPRGVIRSAVSTARS